MVPSPLLAALTGAFLSLATAGAASAAGNPEAGKEKAAVCGGCHGVDGNSAPEIFAAIKAPRLAGQVPAYIVKSLHDFKSGKRTNDSMTPQAQAVADADIENIAAFFASQPAQSLASTNKELLALGEKLFNKGKGRPEPVPACVGCHGLGGKGNQDWSKTMAVVPTVLAPAIGGQHPAYVAAQLSAYKAGTRATDEGRVMREFAHRMSEQEILAVAEYVSTLKR